MGFQVPQRTRVEPTEFEQLYKESWDIFGSEVLRLQQAGKNASEYGKASIAFNHYQGANIYFYMMYTLLAVYEYNKLLIIKEVSCPAKEIECKYNLSCFEKQLGCMSSFYGTNYTGAWEQLLSLFGIDRNLDCPDEETGCCFGIGQMIIEDPDDCKAFILDPCDKNEEQSGEFEPCEFVINNVTPAIGDNVYNDCGESSEAPCNK